MELLGEESLHRQQLSAGYEYCYMYQRVLTLPGWNVSRFGKSKECMYRDW